MVRATRARKSTGGGANEGTPSKRSTRSKGTAELESPTNETPRKKARKEEEDGAEEDAAEESGEEAAAEEPSDEEAADDDGDEAEEAIPDEDDDDEAEETNPDEEAEETGVKEGAEAEAEEETEEDNAAGEKDAGEFPSMACMICGKKDDRPMCHFMPDSEGNGEEIHVHMFCGKIAAISSTHKKPEYEIVDLAAIRNKYAKTYSVTNAMQKTRSATAGKGGKTFYLFKEFEKALNEEQANSGTTPPPKRTRGRPKGSKTGSGAKNAPKAKSKPDGYTLVHSGGVVPSPIPTPQRKEDLDIRRRPCVCDHASCYTILERWVQAGDDMRCGYVSLPSWSTKNTDRSKVVNQFRELVFVNLRGDKKLAQADRNTRKYVAFHHFELFMLLPGNKGLVEYIEPEVAKSIRLDERYRITAGENKGKYLPSPRRAFGDIVKELERIEKKRKGFTAQQGLDFPIHGPPPVANRSTQLEGVDIARLQTRLKSLPKTYDGLKAHTEQVEKSLALELKRKRELEMDLANTRTQLNRIHDNYERLRSMVRELGNEADKM